MGLSFILKGSKNSLYLVMNEGSTKMFFLIASCVSPAVKGGLVSKMTHEAVNGLMLLFENK